MCADGDARTVAAVNDVRPGPSYGRPQSTAVDRTRAIGEKEEGMVTRAPRTILSVVVAAVAAVLLVAPASARIPEGAVARPTQHKTVVPGVLAANSVYATGCANGSISDSRAGGDNNNYEYYGNPCGR